jgi:hypothetical protein
MDEQRKKLLRVIDGRKINQPQEDGVSKDKLHLQIGFPESKLFSQPAWHPMQGS